MDKQEMGRIAKIVGLDCELDEARLRKEIFASVGMAAEKNLQKENGRYSVQVDESIEVQPDCFAYMYEGNSSAEEGEDCRRCIFGELCAREMALSTLGQVETKLGPGHNLEALAKDIGVPELTILYLMGIRDKIAGDFKPRPTIAEPSAGSAKDSAESETKKKKGTGGRPKVIVPGAGPLVDEFTPQRADRGSNWRPEHDDARWLRERQRSKLIAQLEPGMTLHTMYKGEGFQCKVLKRGYKCRGVTYPTLYAVVKDIVGTVERPRQLKDGERPEGVRNISNWSAPRFWKLVQRLEADKAKAKAKPKAKAKKKKAPRRGKKKCSAGSAGKGT